VKPGLNSSTAFYALGTLFGLFSILYFSVEVILEISPAVKSAILLLASLTFFSATGLTSSRWRNIPLYFLASVSYLVFVAYTLLRFDFGPGLTFLILSGSSIAFLIAGYMVGEKELKVPEQKARYLLAAGAILMVGLFLFDLSGPQPEVQLQLRNSVNMTHGEETALGTVRVTNPFVLPRGFEVPNYRACKNSSRPEINVYTERESETIYGGQTIEMELKARFYRALPRNETGKIYTVKRTEGCVERDGQISVYESQGLD
jgi:hypothetical protein